MKTLLIFDNDGIISVEQSTQNKSKIMYKDIKQVIETKEIIDIVKEFLDSSSQKLKRVFPQEVFIVLSLHLTKIIAQFKKIVALSNLIQRRYHNDIRNMLP